MLNSVQKVPVIPRAVNNWATNAPHTHFSHSQIFVCVHMIGDFPICPCVCLCFGIAFFPTAVVVSLNFGVLSRHNANNQRKVLDIDFEINRQKILFFLHRINNMARNRSIAFFVVSIEFLQQNNYSVPMAIGVYPNRIANEKKNIKIVNISSEGKKLVYRMWTSAFVHCFHSSNIEHHQSHTGRATMRKEKYETVSINRIVSCCECSVVLCWLTFRKKIGVKGNLNHAHMRSRRKKTATAPLLCDYGESAWNRQF